MNRFNCVAYGVGEANFRFTVRADGDQAAVGNAAAEAARLGYGWIFVEDDKGRQVFDGKVEAAPAASSAPSEPTSHRDTIEQAAARAFFLSAWTDFMEERGQNFPGQNIEDVAPKQNHPAADAAARRLMRELVERNGLSVDEMYRRACVNNHPGDHDAAVEMAEDGEQARLFGHYLAMEAMGAGVGWSDDHEEHGFAVPDVEFTSLHIERQWTDADNAAWAEIEARGRLAVVSTAGDGSLPVRGADEVDQAALAAIEFLNEEGTIRSQARLTSLERYLGDKGVSLVVDPEPAPASPRR